MTTVGNKRINKHKRLLLRKNSIWWVIRRYILHTHTHSRIAHTFCFSFLEWISGGKWRGKERNIHSFKRLNLRLCSLNFFSLKEKNANSSVFPHIYLYLFRHKNYGMLFKILSRYGKWKYFSHLLVLKRLFDHHIH